MKKLYKDKRGIIGIILFFIVLLFIIIIGFIASIAIGVFDFAADEAVPVLVDLGVVNMSSTSSVNISEVGQYTFGQANNFIQALPWLVGFGYVAMLIFSVIFAISYGVSPHPAFIGAYIMFVVLLIFGAIILSNAYEDIYTGEDDLADRLREQTLLSYMILYSPAIITLIALMTGIYLFAVPKEQSGGFGI